jgi:myosin heavy subunit
MLQVRHQLQCAGVEAVVAIRERGWGARMSLAEFVERYRKIVPTETVR